MSGSLDLFFCRGRPNLNQPTNLNALLIHLMEILWFETFILGGGSSAMFHGVF